MISEGFDRLFPRNDHPVLVGVSGGPDSLCLLHALLRKHCTVVAAHFNHHLRPEADREAEFVRERADSWGVPFSLGEADVGLFAEKSSLSIEEAARILRYRFLFSEAQRRNAQAVAVGHTADDQVETVLMNIIRGAGLQGLTGMSSFSLPNEWSEDIPLVRPLLSVWNEEVKAYCREHQLAPLYDPSNEDLTYHRNRVRHQLIPLLEEYNPLVREKIWQLAEILREDFLLLEKRTQQIWESTLQERGPGYRAFSRGELRELSIGDQRRLIRRALMELRPHFDQIGFAHIERARTFIDEPTELGADNLVGKTQIKLSGDTLYFMTWGAEIPWGEYPQLQEGQRLTIQAPGRVKLDQGWVLELGIITDLDAREREKIIDNQDPYQAWLDGGEIDFPLSLEGRKEGERFSPLGMEEGRLKISDLMINQKIPEEVRARWPILRSGERVLWVPGCQIAHSARVRDETATVLHAALRKE
ncbi:MAG: tRNA lysidine(34) synthetase TilS [Anaerolineales bacterium]